MLEMVRIVYTNSLDFNRILKLCRNFQIWGTGEGTTHKSNIVGLDYREREK